MPEESYKAEQPNYRKQEAAKGQASVFFVVAAMEKLSPPPLTTFVQANVESFREVVQRLTGPKERRCGPPRPVVVASHGSSHDSAWSRRASPGVVSPSGGLAKLCIGEAAAEEEMAIKEKRFYLHSSPRLTGQRKAEPELLPLFPTTSRHASM
ncbi:VQ motif-containing protein [Wolffia australiana]